MKIFRERLSDEELSILKGMIGLELNGILSPKVDTKYGSQTYTLDDSASFSLNQLQKKSYVIFTNHHKETDMGDDYWKLSVEELKHPKNIGYENDEYGYGYALTGNFAGIHIWSTINKIEIYTVDLSEYEEKLEYDAVLVFHFENGLKIAMSHLVFLIEISSDPEKINQMTENCSEKFVLE
ncbi:hypothetical protein GCM10008986_17180 [Salinibacillus aidingensis]|uniref:Uncharacterized protein n=1 Tax=Salinibacillus aidingensis TaxID=237684 RepID=A0ABP3L484_9BACI